MEIPSAWRVRFAGYGSKSRRAAKSGRYLRFSARLYSANRRIGTFRRAAMATFVNGWGVDTDFGCRRRRARIGRHFGPSDVTSGYAAP